MKNILLPTDFSENSWNAIKYAIQLYEDESCTFHLYHAYTPVVYNIEYVLMAPAQFGMVDAVRDAAKESLSKMLIRIHKEFKGNTNHKFETVARFDTLISGVKAVIEQRDINLIVMGTKGATGAKEILFGSNTVQVFNTIKCPILAIPSNYGYEPPHDLLFPTDLKVSYLNTQINTLQDLAVLHHSRVNVLHVSTDHGLTSVQKENQSQLEAIFKESAYLFHDFKNMDIPDAISEFQVKHKINFLAMINNKHSIFENLFFKNTINQIGFHLNIPFLVIPSKK